MCLDCVAEPISILNGALAPPAAEIDPAPCQSLPETPSLRNSRITQAMGFMIVPRDSESEIQTSEALR